MGHDFEVDLTYDFEDKVNFEGVSINRNLGHPFVRPKCTTMRPSRLRDFVLLLLLSLWLLWLIMSFPSEKVPAASYSCHSNL